MDRTKVYVLSHGAQWKVKGSYLGEKIVSTQSEAIKIAKKHVADLGAGILSQILIQGDGGRYRAEWTYGKDPYPPKG